MFKEGYKVLNDAQPVTKPRIGLLKTAGFLVSIFFGFIGYAAFSSGAWVLLVLGVVLIGTLYYLAGVSKSRYAEDAIKGVAASMFAGLIVVCAIAVVAWIVSGVGSAIGNLNFGTSEKPEYARAKQLMNEFSCATSNGKWGKLMASDKEKAQGRLQLYERGMNPSNLSIDQVIENDLSSFRIACQASNEDSK